MTHTIENARPEFGSGEGPGGIPGSESELAQALVRLSHLVQQVFGDVSRGYCLTPQQTQLLCRLVDGPVGMAELSRMLHLEKSSLTGLVDRVEKRGLVRRVRGTADRRACQVELTSEGERLGADSHQDITARLESLAGEVSPDDRERLTALISGMLLAHGDLDAP